MAVAELVDSTCMRVTSKFGIPAWVEFKFIRNKRYVTARTKSTIKNFKNVNGASVWLSEHLNDNTVSDAILGFMKQGVIE